MAYSLNPKDLREELKTYKQPVYVASTQPAQQSVAPASTSPYRQQKRSDGGTDFYNGNQKITIEEFSKGTGNQVDAVRGNLAAGGSKFDQDVLTKQYFETKDPEVTKFNTSDVYSQRQRIADLQGLAGRTKFNSQEDIKNRDWAQQQLANIETYGKKQGGNPLTFAQDAVAAAPSAYKRIGEGFGEVFGAGVQGEADKAQADYQQGVAETVRNLTDNMNKTADPVAKERYKQAISNIAAQSDLLSAQQEATQTQVAERTDPTKAAGAVASIGLDVVTAGAGSKLVGAAVKGGQTATAGSKLVNFTNTVLNPQTIRQGAVSGSTLGAAYGGAGTAEQMGADATLQDYASGIGTGAAIGAVTGAAIPATIKAGQVIGDATTTGAKNVARAVENVNPQLAQINETLDNYKRAFDVETNPTRREQINQGIAQLNTERRRILERGSIQVPGGKSDLAQFTKDIYAGTPVTLSNGDRQIPFYHNGNLVDYASNKEQLLSSLDLQRAYDVHSNMKPGGFKKPEATKTMTQIAQDFPDLNDFAYNRAINRSVNDISNGLQLPELYPKKVGDNVQVSYQGETGQGLNLHSAISLLNDKLVNKKSGIIPLSSAERAAKMRQDTIGLNDGSYKVSPGGKALDADIASNNKFTEKEKWEIQAERDANPYIPMTQTQMSKFARKVNNAVAKESGITLTKPAPAPQVTKTAEVGKIDPLESLKAEARKYKSADEFVKAQGEPVYHRSPNKFDKFDMSKVSNDTNRQKGGWGLYFSDSVEAIPEDAYGKYLYEVQPPKGTLLDTKNPVDEKIVSKIVNAVRGSGKNPSELSDFSYNGYLFYKTLSRVLGGDKEASLFLSKNGIDGLKRAINPTANDYILFSDKSIRTKKQLTDLYNQATQPTPKAPDVPEAPQVTKTPKQPTTQKSAFEADLEAAGLTPYRKQSKAMREAVDQAVYETDPLLFESGSTGAFEAGIPKIKPSSIKEVTGLSARESGIPPRYLSEKDGVALDRLAAEFEGNKGGYGQLTMTSEDMLDVVKKELDTRAASREQKKLLAEMRNDPEIQKRAAIISRTDPESGLYIDEPLALQRENQIAADLEAAGITAPRQAKTKFTRTVKQSMDTPQNVKEAMKGKDGTYTTTSDAQREFAAEKFIKAKGLNSATSDIKERLLDPNFIDNSQNAVDAIKIAEKLAKKGDIQQSVDIYEQLAEKMSKSGQFMQAAAMLARMTPEGVQYRAIKELKKANIELTPERVATLDGYIKEVRSTQDQLGKLKSSKASKTDIVAAEEAASIARENVQYYIATQIPEKLASKLVNFWRAGLLTAPTTTGGAVLGNTETLLTRKLWTNPAATMADWVMSAFTGKRTQSFAKTGELAKGAVEGAKALNGQYWKTGRDAMLDGQRMGKYDQPNQKINYGQKPLGRAIGGYVNGVYSLMGAVDKPFRYGAYRESLSSQARAAVDTMRLQNKKINRQEARKLYNDMMENPSTEMKQRATDEALYETFQNKTIAGELIGNMKQWAKREGHSKTAALMDFLMPFTGVPSAIAARVIQRTPIGTANEIVKQIVNVKKNGGKFDQRAMARAIGEGTAGIPVIAAGAALAGSGMITGGYPRDEKTRNEWEQTGKQPNSVKIGDQWYSLNYLQPFGTLLAIGSAIGQEKLDEGSIQDIIVKGASTAANSVVSMSFLDGISNALSIVTEGASESSVGRFVGNTAASAIPNFIRSGTRAADDVQRDTKGDNVIDTAIKSVAGALPGTRQLLPAKTDQFGQPLPAKNNFLNQFFNPLRPSQSIGQDDPSVQELSRLLSIDSGVKPTEATKATFKDHELKYSEIKELNQLAGPKMKEEYDKLVQSPEYAALSDEDKVKALKKVNDTVFGAVKAQWGYDKGYVTEEQLKDLNSNQRRYAQGNGANYITGGIGDTKLDSKSTAYKFLDSKPEMTDDEKATWSRSEALQEYRPMVDEFNSQLPDGLPKVPYTNNTAELISEFQKAKADNNWSKLELNDKTKDLAINTYKAQLTDNERFITTLSDADIVTAADNGEISREELNRIIAIDDITTKLGGSQMIGNKTRKLLGYGTIASKSGGGKSSSAKKSYKLNAFGDVSGEVSGNLRKLIEQATIKGV